ncbi:MAG: hypothetical protein AAGI01_04985, partial [Myxococcota bacterium]
LIRDQRVCQAFHSVLMDGDLEPVFAGITATANWISGDADSQLVRGQPSFFVQRMGQLSLAPTGRRTDDGWIELGSGPFDFLLGHRIAPAALTLTDVNTAAGASARIARDPEAHALLDALGVYDLGPARTPDAACTMTTEAEQCGAQGVCLLGRCAGAEAVFGSAPQNPDVRRAYLARRDFEVRHFNGVRLARDKRPAFEGFMAEADSDNPKTFWLALSKAFNALTDGHGTTPSASKLPEFSPGACAYPGTADLLDGATSPLITEVFDGVPYGGGALEPGDVIVSIDGREPSDFGQLARGQWSYGGDKSAEDVIATPELLRWAARTGSPFTVRRCANPNGCADGGAEDITVTTADVLGAPIWSEELPSWRFTSRFCDWRGARIEEAPDERVYGFAGFTSERGVPVVVFNGFPAPDTGDGQSGWLVTLGEVLESGPTRVLLDQRWGTGGSPAALRELYALLFRATDPRLVGETIPAVDAELDADQRARLRACRGNCGMFARFVGTPEADGPSADTRVAVLNGYDVSANDYFANRMAARPGRTRIFGPGATFGAFGFACQLPAHLPGERSVGYQCTDTVFFEEGDEANTSTGFVSGAGVSPDELTLPKQSDARVGVDTARSAALDWLLED